MFNFFRKKKKPLEVEYSFFSNVVNQLPAEYDYLKEQVTDDFILGKNPNPLGEAGCYTFLLNANLESRFSNKSLPNFFIIRDIKIWNNVKKAFEQMELHILQGMLCGYMTKAALSDLDDRKVDVSCIKEKRFAEDDKVRLNEILGTISAEVSALLDLQTTFKIDLLDESYYVIKDFKDGNYLTVNEAGSIYFMMHDPYKVDKIYEDKDSFLRDLESGKFNIIAFYESQFNDHTID